MNNALAAEIKSNALPIARVARYEDRVWLTIDIPNGWDDCKKLTKKVLTFEGQNFVWRSWNSDKNECYFVSSDEIATIKR